MSKDIATVVTDRIIEALEQGVAPWSRPWKRVAGHSPSSLSTNRPYQGINRLILETTQMLEGYSSPWWGTYRQIESRGGQVRKGERGTPVVLWKRVAKQVEENGEQVDKSYALLRYFTVFNVDQCDGLTVEVEELPEFDPIERAEEISLGMPQRPMVKHGGDSAFYHPASDYVRMPEQGAFESSEAYYGVLFHELTHATGHEDRLDRETIAQAAPFGSEVYAQEELVAEIAAAILCSEAQIDPNIERSAAYVGNWLKFVKEDRNAILKAAAAAQKAASFILRDTPAAKEQQA